MQTLEEEGEWEDDIFSEARNDSGKITKGEISKRIKEIKNDPEFADELKALTDYNNIMNKESELKKQIKQMKEELDKELLAKYKSLTEDELKFLVIEDKWMTFLHNSIQNEMERVSQNLTGRIKVLAERYETPLPVLDKDVKEFTKKVESHLERMGFKW